MSFNASFLQTQKFRLDRAIEAYSHAIAVNPHHARAYHYLASAYERKGEFDKAIVTYSTDMNVKKKDYVVRFWQNFLDIHLPNRLSLT